MSGAAELTNGFLPAQAFGHMEPTAIGVLDLAPWRMSTASSTGAPAAQSVRDALLLVRLHGEPLGIVHVPSGATLSEPERLWALVAEALGSELKAHGERFGCSTAAEAGPGGEACPGSEARPGSEACPGAEPPPLPGSAAVIIPTGGRAAKLERCLRSLLPALPREVEVIVVDNRPRERSGGGSQTRTVVSRIAEQDARLRYLAEERPGSSVARNRGIASTAAEFVAFTDDDVVIDSGWLPWLLAPFADARVNAVTGLVLPLELGSAAQKRFEQYAGFGKGVLRREYSLHGESGRERLLYPYWGGVFGSGNSMAFRRTELACAGGLDPALGAGSLALAGSDIEAMSAAILRGGHLVYEPRALVWHEHRRDDGALRRQIYNYGAGFTAILTKALLHDRRFLPAVARSVPVGLRLHRRRRGSDEASVSDGGLPRELTALQRRGMLRGPLLYGRSRRWARRLELGQVIRGA
jgi:GT2 family glycosyltransferase